MLQQDCHKPRWKERFIDGLPPIFAHKVKQVLISADNSLNYDNLTNDNIFNAIKKFDTSMSTNKKLLMYQLQINFCKQNGLPPFRQKGKTHDKNHKIYSHKKYKNNFVKSNYFHAKKKNVSGKYKQLGNFKNKSTMLKIINKNKKELFKILESNNSSKDDFSSLNWLNLLKIIPCKKKLNLLKL